MRLSYPLRELVHWTWVTVRAAVLTVVVGPVVAVLVPAANLAWEER